MNFDKAFDNFLEGRECDQASDALYAIIRAAFTAGWLCAGGKAPPAREQLTTQGVQGTIFKDLSPTATPSV